MSGWRIHNLLAITVTVLWVGLVLALAIGLPLGAETWPARVAMLGAGLVVAGGSVALLVRRHRLQCRTAEKYFQALCELDVCNLGRDGGRHSPPPLPPDNPWSEVSDRVLKLLEECTRRTQELKHTRTAWEIRHRRVAAELEQIKAIFAGLAEPVVAVDSYGELVLANRSAERLLNLGEADADADADAETRVLAQVVQCQKLVNLLMTAARRKAPRDRTDEIEIPDRDGRSHWYRVTASKLAPGGQPGGQPGGRQSGVQEPAGQRAGRGGAVAVFRDVDNQKALQKRNAEFISAVSHEMKTPLAGIKAYVELLVDGDAEDEQTQEEFLSVINGQADRLQRLVDNMLNLARIEAGVVNVSKKTRSLNELLEEALHVVQPAAEAKQVELSSDLSPMYLGVLADRDMLLQSAINLLSNAVKYTPGGGKVTLRSRLEDDQVRFEVQDTGVGLSEEDCRRVFEKFYRVSKDKNMAAGTGLGLPLAKHIVEDVHGGRLTVESTLDQGSTFAATLPSAGQLT